MEQQKWLATPHQNHRKALPASRNTNVNPQTIHPNVKWHSGLYSAVRAIAAATMPTARLVITGRAHSHTRLVMPKICSQMPLMPVPVGTLPPAGALPLGSPA